MKKKLTFWIPVAIIVLIGQICFIVFSFAVVPWSIMYFGIELSEDPPEPAITYGEFPFELVYEIDGKRTTVNDVYVCEYKGIRSNEAGKFRDWDGYIKSTGNANLTLCEDEVRKVCCTVGNSRYYMGEWKQKEPPTPYVFEVIHDSYDFDERMKLWINSEEELMAQYNIKLISWKFSEPIENTFE